MEKGEHKFCTHCRDYNKIAQGRERIRGMVRGPDHNTCKSRGKVWDKTKRFDVHHMNEQCGKLTPAYDDISTIHTMITLCHKCHFNMHDHRQYGTNSGTLHAI